MQHSLSVCSFLTMPMSEIFEIMVIGLYTLETAGSLAQAAWQGFL